MAKKEKGEMSFLDHLEELRWLLIRSTVAILILSCVAWYFIDFIFDTLLFGPADPNFVTYQFFCKVATFFGEGENACTTEFQFDIQNTDVGGQFSLFMWTCITAGFIMAVPYILWEVWKFISPALYEKERRMAASFVVVSSLLFFLGVLFGYFIVIPLSVNFFGTFIASDMIKNDFNVESYTAMIKTSAIGSGIVFELPVIIYFLTRIGLVGPAFLRKHRRIAIVLILILAAIVTPPEISSQIIVSLPILALYEASILISAIVERNKLKNEQLSR
ncbi:MAG TPA: twin-arginine translocase subunit TatC [Flavobacterium sp.]|nr:twin-arginine translocase subunit TatC [Flavobacterium sp.]